NESAARAHLWRLAAGKLVSPRCSILGGRTRLAAALAGDRPPHGARLQAAGAQPARLVRSGNERPIGRRLFALAARSLQRPDARRTRRLQRRTERRRTLDADDDPRSR